MFKGILSTARYPIEFSYLLGLVFFLPLFEAPKNIFWALYLVTWLVNRFRARDFGGRWETWDTLILLWLLSGYLLAPLAGLKGSEWRGANDILRYGSILWLVKRSGYGNEALKWLLIMIPVSTFVALSWALWVLFTTHRLTLELNSVGHANHSAVYLAISYGALLAALLSFWKALAAPWRAAGVLLAALFAVSLLLSYSRAGAGIMFLLSLLMGAVWLRRSRFPLIVLLSAAAVIGGGAYIAQISTVQKQESDMQENIFLSYRGEMWNVASVVWHKYPAFGVGMDNYSQVSEQKIKGWLKESGKPFDPDEYAYAPHAHSLYLNTLAERGFAGLAVVLAVLAYWARALLRHAPRANDANLDWALWGGALSAFFVTIVVGFVNTTLHHEHGLLSALLLGAWLAHLNNQAAAGLKPS